MLRRGACSLIAVALTTSSCSQAMTSVNGGELARLSAQPEIVAIHYAATPPFAVKQPRSVGRATAVALLLTPFVLPFGPLAPIIGREMGNALQAHVEKSAAEAAGEALSTEIALEDPVTRVKERVIASLNTAGEIRRIRPMGPAVDSDDLRSLKQALGPTTVLDVKTMGWGLVPYMEDPKTFMALYRVRTRIIRLDKEKVVSHSDLTCAFAGDRRFGAPTLDELRAAGGSLLKTTMAKAAENCVEPILARLHGHELPRPAPHPGVDATVDPSTLAEAKTKLVGPSGLVSGSVKFEAKFKRVALTAQDLPQLRTLLIEATASPWGSEVQIRGTMAGTPFKAKMDKGSSGRVEFGFEGLSFDDEAQARVFLAPLQGRGVREVKLVGIAGDLPIKIVLGPPSSSPNEAKATPVASAASATFPAVSAAPPPSTEPEPELKRMVGTWKGTFAGPPRSSSDLGIRQDVTLRIFEQGGVIRWESRRHSAGQEVSRGSGAVALSEDGIVLVGRRRDARSSATVPVNLPLTRRGRTLEASVLSHENIVYTIVLIRSR